MATKPKESKKNPLDSQSVLVNGGTAMKVDNTEVLNALGTLTDAVLGLVKKLETPKTPIVAATPYSVDANKSPAFSPQVPTATIQTTVPTQQGSFPIPPEYRGLVDTILNWKFKIEIGFSADAVGFNFAVLVPREYSNAPEPHWLTYGEDRRNKVIQNAFGINGVREYLQQVYDNFGLETKAKIVADRAQV